MGITCFSLRFGFFFVDFFVLFIDIFVMKEFVGFWVFKLKVYMLGFF